MNRVVVLAMQMNSIGMNILSAFSNLIIICHSAFSNLIISNKTTIVTIFVTHPSYKTEEKKNIKYLRNTNIKCMAPLISTFPCIHPSLGRLQKNIHPTQIFWIVVAPMSDVRSVEWRVFLRDLNMVKQALLSGFVAALYISTAEFCTMFLFSWFFSRAFWICQP